VPDDLEDTDRSDADGEWIPRRGPRPATKMIAWSILALIAVSVVGLVIGLVTGDDDPKPPIGRLSEPELALPNSVPAVRFVDATADFDVTDPIGSGFSDPMAGGVAAVDLDSDGRVDIVVAHGDLAVLRSIPGGFAAPVRLPVNDAVSVTASDIDLDGNPDLLVARTGSIDTVFWGGDWLSTPNEPTSTDLSGARPSSQLLAGDLNGDGLVDIVRLGRSRGPSDTIWLASPDDPRVFDRAKLPGGDRISLTAELADVDGDGLIDIWVNRDVGWKIGPDAVFSRQGVATGPWADIAPEIGAALRIDAMGITIADLNGNGRLDAYISDIGDNEVLLAGPGGFTAAASTGAARIRPPGAVASVVSSSWASGAADFNLDGILDLVVVNGGFPDGGEFNKIPATSVAVIDPPAILLGIGDGRFVDVWADLGITWRSADRGMAIADLDGDGDDDIITVSVEGEVAILRNEIEGPSLAISAPARCATTGSVVTVTSSSGLIARLLSPHAFAGSHSPVVIVGANSGEVVEVSLTGVGGAAQTRNVTIEGRSSLVLDCP